MGSVPDVWPRPAGDPTRLERLERLRWGVSGCFESHGVRFALRSNGAVLDERLPDLLPPGSRACADAAVDHVFSLWVPREGRRGAVRVYSDHRRAARVRSLDDALVALESEIRRSVATDSPRLTFVHAGAVGWRGRALLLPGASRSGKTSLVAALVKAGADYLSDEFAVLDADGLVHPFAKRLSLRGPGGCDRHARRATAEQLGGRAAAGPLPVGMVVVTGYREGARFEARPLTAGRAVLALLGHTAAARLRPAATLGALENAVRSAVCVEGERGEADEAARALLARAGREWGGRGAHEEDR